jgi:aminodeoxyfutalosine synthase
MADIRHFHIKDELITPIAEAVIAGERLTREQGLYLYSTPDLNALGGLARWVKEQRHGKSISYVLNRQINPTNLCVFDCTFCDFAAKPGDEHAYEFGVDEILSMLDSHVREVHIVGGLHPKWPYEEYLSLVQKIHAAYPDMQIKAWTAVEVDWFAKLTKRPVRDILLELQSAGVVSLPGGGAEVFSERIRQALFRQKLGADRWCEIHREAHSIGMKSNATLLYGHMETLEERVDHLLTLRDLEDEVPGFLAFIPLSYQKGHNGVITRDVPPADDLRTIAVSRLMLDNIPHIKAYWVMLGLSTTAMALNFGADDLDGTIGQERIAHAAEAESPEALERQTIQSVIRDAGLTARERDALHHTIESVPA